MFSGNYHLKMNPEAFHHNVSSIKLKCHMCDKAYASVLSLKRHLQTHHETQTLSQKLPCNLCNKSFITQQNLDNHIKRYHVKLIDKFCAHCAFSCSDQSTLQKHFLNEHGGIHSCKAKCFLCDAEFKTVPNLNRHIKHIHEKAPRKYWLQTCELCGYSTDNKIRLKKHVSWFHMKRYICNWCDFSSEDNSQIRFHEGVTHIGKNTYCKFCDFFAVKKYEVKDHVLRTHDNVMQGQCMFCNQKFARINDLHVHINGKHDLAMCYNCMECDYATYSEKLLKSHLTSSGHLGTPNETTELIPRGKRIPRGKPKSKCLYCDYSTFDQICLKKHMSLNHFQCYICGWCDFSSEDANKVRMHEGINHPEFKAHCTFCSYFSCSKYDVKQHVQLIHDKVRDMICLFCGQWFSRKNDLDLHIKGIHDLLMNLKCIKCGYKTYSEKLLKRHIIRNGHIDCS